LVLKWKTTNSKSINLCDRSIYLGDHVKTLLYTDKLNEF